MKHHHLSARHLQVKTQLRTQLENAYSFYIEMADSIQTYPGESEWAYSNYQEMFQ